MDTWTAQCLSTARDLPSPLDRRFAGYLRLRSATVADAGDIARLIMLASAGIATRLWSREAGDGRDPLAVGTARVARPDGNFSYRNVVLAERDGQVAGMMLGYWLDRPVPANREMSDIQPPILRSLAELASLVPGSYLVNMLAVYDGHRDSGIGTRLLQAAASRATAHGCTRLSAQVFGQNLGAVRLYERNGFRTVDSRPVAMGSCRARGDRILLMLRSL